MGRKRNRHRHLVFAYGSLLSGLGNNRVFTDGRSKFVAKATTLGRWVMEAMLGYPGVHLGTGKHTKASKIKGELWRCTNKGLALVDRLEGYQGPGKKNYYERALVAVKDEEGHTFHAWMYFLTDGVNKDTAIVPNGDWRAYTETDEYKNWLADWRELVRKEREEARLKAKSEQPSRRKGTRTKTYIDEDEAEVLSALEEKLITFLEEACQDTHEILWDIVLDGPAGESVFNELPALATMYEACRSAVLSWRHHGVINESLFTYLHDLFRDTLEQELIQVFMLWEATSLEMEEDAEGVVPCSSCEDTEVIEVEVIEEGQKKLPPPRVTGNGKV